MKNNKKGKILGIASILIGGTVCSIYMISYFLFDYFSAIGIAEWMTPFLLGILLILGGISFLFFSSNLGETILLGFAIGNLVDRILVSYLFFDHISFDIYSTPLISSAIAFLLWFFNRSRRRLNFNLLLFVVFVVIAMIVSPKVILL